MCSPGRQNEKSNDLEFVPQSKKQIKNLEFTKREQLEVKIKDPHVVEA